MNKNYEKPIVFFSHSSKDENVLMKLKEIIDKKTGEAIDIFLSSDGQSIPLGKNWVVSLEKGLEKASIMFVFLSPNSIDSNWVYFEAGYSYSRGIDVIPIGIHGVNLTEVNPPLSLLQGFNLDKYQAMGNIIEVINKTYDTEFDIRFSEQDYGEFEDRDNESISLVEQLVVHVPIKMQNEDAYNTVTSALEEEKIECAMFDNKYLSHGLQIDVGLQEIVLSVVGVMIEKRRSLFEKLIRELLSENGININIYISEKYRICDIDFRKQTAGLSETEVKVEGHRQLKYKGVMFGINQPHSFSEQSEDVIWRGRVTLKLFGRENLIENTWLDELTNLLLENNVIIDKSKGT